MNDYVQGLAGAFLGDNPDPQFVADIADGYVRIVRRKETQ